MSNFTIIFCSINFNIQRNILIFRFLKLLETFLFFILLRLQIKQKQFNVNDARVRSSKKIEWIFERIYFYHMFTILIWNNACFVISGIHTREPDIMSRPLQPALSQPFPSFFPSLVYTIFLLVPRSRSYSLQHPRFSSRRWLENRFCHSVQTLHSQGKRDT